MFAGTLRRGSGITGSGGWVWAAAVVIGPEALSWTSRPFGAGFGTGTFCAEQGTAPITNAAISTAKPAHAPWGAGCSFTTNFVSLFNELSRLATHDPDT